jgi:FkbM family methyltransferase
VTTRLHPERVDSNLREEILREVEEILAGLDPERARMVDALFFDRLILERSPSVDDRDRYAQRVAGRSPFELLFENLPGTDAQAHYPHVPCVNRELMWQRDDGLRIFFNLRDLAVGMQICQGTFDPENEQLLDRLVAPGMSVIDVGANLGWYTLLMARAGARVHALEAFPYNHGLLTRNVAENGLTDSVVTHLVGCASEPGTGRVCAIPNTVNLGSMFVLTDPEVPTPDGFDSVEIPLARVDDLVPATEVIEIVKMDIEGAELTALQGMERILTRDRPVILLELNSRTLREYHGVEPRDLVEYLRSFGYRLAEAQSMLTGTPTMIGEVEVGAHVFMNLVCFPA